MTLTRKVRLVWRNPYITDGLVFHLDGIWNVKGDTHDSSSTTWTDLARGIRHPIGDGNSFIANALSIDAPTERWLPTKDLINNSTGFTIEALGYVREEGQSLIQIGDNINFSPYPNWSSHNDCYVVAFRFGLGAPIGGLGTAVYSAVTYDGSTGTIHIPQTDRRKSQSFELTVPEWRNSMIHASHQCIHAIRFYNRPLSYDEIATNYSIDKSRFNLLPEVTLR